MHCLVCKCMFESVHAYVTELYVESVVVVMLALVFIHVCNYYTCMSYLIFS